jgi:hypothetical protein
MITPRTVLSSAVDTEPVSILRDFDLLPRAKYAKNGLGYHSINISVD